ncbi:hypothetical protein EMIHUDRAFT_240649 [Emiliania huxleyi CCMP1516]|uniref:Xrn1 helical domain-containing protein n=2 Tax=Emiliania huxleyi TaxID=2903 RepID=A0A0D3JEP7_EMIH1|nr:hypothetical protein EMIHUDRAFT_240649 [Emiliania huxleyi CCMP1516]EOD21982.1 hypothetical protein EMIHUDRAFT_240649 [Emiliania huxleyi CCMP1516]|eukprot:XP_005774411.1 hypothetical protein EMIHUDRAFT_240649 [Emiliania huxleyi CCMP1516]
MAKGAAMGGEAVAAEVRARVGRWERGEASPSREWEEEGGEEEGAAPPSRGGLQLPPRPERQLPFVYDPAKLPPLPVLDDRGVANCPEQHPPSAWQHHPAELTPEELAEREAAQRRAAFEAEFDRRAKQLGDAPPEARKIVPGEPFSPLEQLMAVLPPRSAAHALPSVYAQLMEPGSPLAHLYPLDFRQDLNGAPSRGAEGGP